MSTSNANGPGTAAIDLAATKNILASSSTSRRISHLKFLTERISQKSVDVSEAPKLLPLLFQTHPYYHDRESRSAVQSCLKAILSLPLEDGHLSAFASLIRQETKKFGIAATNAFVLVEWCSILMQELAGTPQWDRVATDVYLSLVETLDKILDEDARSTIGKSGLVVTRRGFRKLFKSTQDLQKLIEHTVKTLSDKGSQPTARNSILLGIIAGVSSRNERAKPILEELKPQYFSFYVREMLGSKIPLPPHLARALHDFFAAFVIVDDITDSICPPLEKSLLRSPEVVLCDLVTPLVEAVPAGFDLAPVLKGNALKHILSNARSSKANIREGALTAFKALVKRCKSEDVLSNVLGEVLAPLKGGKLSSPDHKIIYAQALGCEPLQTKFASNIAAALPPVVGKEGNEAALSAEVATLTTCVSLMISQGLDLEKPILDAYSKGLADKKMPSRRVWFVHTGDLIYSTRNAGQLSPQASRFVAAVIPSFSQTWAEVLKAPLLGPQNGLAAPGYVVCAVVFLLSLETPGHGVDLKRFNMDKQGLSTDPKTGFLLHPKVYAKASTSEEHQWILMALTASSSLLDGAKEDQKLAWSQAFISLITSTTVNPRNRRAAVAALLEEYGKRPEIVSKIMVNGIWEWLRSGEADEKDAASHLVKHDQGFLYLALNALCPPISDRPEIQLSQEGLEQQLCSLVVLARPDLIPRADWINLCIRSGLDPGNLAAQYQQELLEMVMDKSGTHKSPIVRAAAYNAAAELAFVSPEHITPHLVDLIRKDLDPTALSGIGPVEAAIFRTPEGTAFVDVLAKKSSLPDKNTKDYDILKWEEELRSQLAQKKGQRRKLTAEETAKVKAQLQKESEIRKSVAKLEANLMRGTGIIKSLATGPPTEAIFWISPAVTMLLNAMDAGACLITGDAAPLAYIALSERIAPRLGTIRPFIGIATLRSKDLSPLPENLSEEPFEDQVTRVLYRLRLSGEQRPFDAVTLIYVLPLVLRVLEMGGFGSSSDDQDAQIVLAVEFLSFHTDTCSDEAVPRSKVLSMLISCMRQYKQHYKMIKDCFSDLIRCVAPNMTNEEVAVLAKGTIVPETSVRTAALQAISTEVELSDVPAPLEIWIACYDDDEENRELAADIWEEGGFDHDDVANFRDLLPHIHSKDPQLRRAAARSLAAIVANKHEKEPNYVKQVTEMLEESYIELAQPKKQELDKFGMPKKMDLSDPWEARHGIAFAFMEMAPCIPKAQLEPFFGFLIENGPLSDQSDAVRGQMLDAANKTIDIHGKGILERLMKSFEKTLESSAKKSQKDDLVNEAVVIMYGALARHLKKGDSKLPVVIDRLLATLSTPSETVQLAIAECLPPLIRVSGDKSPKYFDQVTQTLLAKSGYAAQRGAAYGLAGLVKGRGIAALKEYRIMMTLQTAMENKKEPYHREAALLAYELMSTVLGRVFEPYVLQIVPQLLTGFGDPNSNVRESALATAKACFARLSSFGVKKILPTLLEGLDEPQWRSKKGACDLLGATAYLDPQQLAHSLPEIIPPLTAVLSDSHKEVRATANRSLKRFGDIISNPEIKSLIDILLKALSDPSRYTDDALDGLIKVHFVHYLDAPSLALVTKILQRGLGDRSNTKQKAARVIGSLAHLTERRDLVSHLPVLVSGLKVAVVDPVPTTRATASRALGSLMEKLGEDALPDLIPGLMQTLKSDTGAGDRLGSAQALSEVLAGLGTSRLEETLPTILQNVESSKPSVREGFMSLFIFLPVCFGNSFSGYLGRIIPPILAGLADDVDSIRETALRAGRLLVKNFATRAVDLLLPELERGLSDDSWRIRLSSVELVGDLLFNLTGVSGNAEPEEENEDAVREASVSLREVLGEEKRNKILSALYICRCDTAGAVRSAAIGVWKALVPSPRILKELVPTLSQLIIRRLGSTNMEHKVIASNSLGELIRKAGDGVLASLLPTLEEGLQTSTDSDAKQGICLALRELISSASHDALEDHEKTLISVVRTALTDADADVREAAAEAFDSLQQIFGKKAVDQVLPYLLNLLRSDEEADNALAALLTLLTDNTRSNIIIPTLIPTLIAPPISAFNAKALASLSRVAGAAMNRRLPGIITSLLDNIINCEDESLRGDLDASFDVVILSIDEYDGLNTVMNVLLQLVKHEDHRKRITMGRHMASFFFQAHVDYSRYNQDIIRSLLILFDDRDNEVVIAAWSALSQFTKKLKKEEMEALVPSSRQTLLQVGVKGVNLPGFELPKGISAILPIFLQGLMNGTPEQRTQAALAISDIVDRTSEASLKPFVTQITGPLIRVVSERSTEVKSAILLTLNNLLEKMPLALKPFLPQLQRTFAKSLADPSSDLLRSRAAKALGTLIKFTPRVDPLIAELVTGSKTTDAGVRTAMLKALYEVISKAGSNMGESSRTAVLNLIDSETDEKDDAMTITYAKLLGALIKNVSPEVAEALLKNRVATTNFSNSSVLALNAVFVESPTSLLGSDLVESLPDTLCEGMESKNTYWADNCILASGKFLLSDCHKPFEASKRILETLADVISPGQPADSRRLALVIARTLSRSHGDMIRPHLALLAPPVFASVRDPVIPVKLAAEAAFVALFDVADEEGRLFEKFMSSNAAESIQGGMRRSMQDYFKRVTLRLGAQVRERREAEGGEGGLGLANDEVEDEKEIWSVGKVDVGADIFGRD
ncbi:translational activator gcn1 [Zalerion maritima]|uniref:eIF-2-alpha kinase activator GCN1 n=1 Tax=Zalerion maritima TaxID=339359 RepID=A0AAD5RHP9_9PEZI|nr:translational activator gcn1 [Zalerion maritima]